MNAKLLKPYKGFEIEKTWEENVDGTIKKDTILYTAFTEGDLHLYDASKKLADLKKKIDTYIE